jgi:hypothetical protein
MTGVYNGLQQFQGGGSLVLLVPFGSMPTQYCRQMVTGNVVQVGGARERCERGGIKVVTGKAVQVGFFLPRHPKPLKADSED